MDGGRTAGEGTAGFRERLWAPAGWWAVSTVLVLSLAVAVGYPLGTVAGVVAFALAEGAVGWVLVSAAAQVCVGDGMLVAGRARLPLAVVSAVTALDAEAAALLRGRQADARAFLLLRPWVREAVRVDLADPDDPTPYWYVSTRHPARLAAATAVAAGLEPGAGPDPQRGAGAADRPDGAG